MNGPRQIARVDVGLFRAAAALQRRGRTEIATLVPAADSRGEVWTHAYRRDESYSRVDLILISAGLLPRLPGREAGIHDGPGVRAASDHRPVYVDLLDRPARTRRIIVHFFPKACLGIRGPR